MFKKIVILMAIGVMAASTSASAQLPKMSDVINIGVDVDVSDDLKRRIDQMPDKIRDALIDVVTKALLPAAETILKQADGVLQANIALAAKHFDCSTMGLVERLWFKFKPNWLLYNDGDVIGFTEILSRNIFNARGRFTTETTGLQVRSTYHDLVGHGEAIKCAVGGVSEDAAKEVSEILMSIAPSRDEWSAITGRNITQPRCGLVRDCVVLRLKDIDVFIDSADPIDSKAADARAEWTKLSIPAYPEERIFSWGKPSIQIADYEAILLALRKIESGIVAHDLTRRKKAEVDWNAAQKQAKDAADMLSLYGGKVQSEPITVLENLDKIIGPAKAAKARALDASQKHRDFGDKASAMTKEMDGVLKSVDALQARADERSRVAPPIVMPPPIRP